MSTSSLPTQGQGQRQSLAEPAFAAAVPAELAERGRREREFFNQYSDPERIPDSALTVPPSLEDLPEEIGICFPSLEDVAVCDFGCGYGIFSAYFAQRGAKVSAFDIADNHVLLARRAARLNGVSDRVAVEIMQGECLSYPDQSFDVVFDNAVLHHLHIPWAAHEIHRVLKPGGVAIFREPMGENWLLEWVRNCPLRSGDHRHTADEHSLLYADMDGLRAVFPDARLRESELLTVLGGLVRGHVGLTAIPRFEALLEKLARMDRWLLSCCPPIRRFASYAVVSLPKPADAERALPAWRH